MGGGRAVPHAASMGLPARPGTRVLFDFQGTEPNAERRSVILPCPEMWRCVWRWDWVFISDGHLEAGCRVISCLVRSGSVSYTHLTLPTSDLV